MENDESLSRKVHRLWYSSCNNAMKTNLKSNKVDATIEKVFKRYGHTVTTEQTKCKGSEEIGRKQRRRQAKLLKKTKGMQKNDAKQPPKTPASTSRSCELSKKSTKKRKRKSGELSSDDVRKKALRIENKHEDKMIGALEKKLFLNKSKNKKKLPKSFVDSGLDYILDVVNGEYLGSGDEDDFFSKSSKDATVPESPKSEIHSEVNVTDSIGPESDVMSSDNDDESSDNDSADISDAQEDDTSMDDRRETVETNFETPAEKYIPPAMRVNLSDEQEKNKEKLRRKVKGLLNRLSESNMSSICDDIEKLYLANSRAILHKVITDLMMGQFSQPDPSPESMIVENAALISALSIRVSVAVLMNVYEVVSLKLHSLIKDKDESDGKASNNLLQLLCFLYQYKVIDCKVILDVFRLLIDSFTEKDVELILEVLNKVGFQMRKEDPESLKNMIQDISAKCNDLNIATEGGSRMSYMLSVLTAIKNNNIRKVTSYDPDAVTKRRKKLAWMTKERAGSNMDTVPPITLQDFLDIEKNGRWWIVGSSFSGRPMLRDDAVKETGESSKSDELDFTVSQKIVEAAKLQRMNTDVRRKIFYSVMGADDYVDAFQKIMKCNLKGKQLREIANVVVDCCQRGKSYNPYYMHLLNRFCQYDRQFAISVQCTLWDRFKVLGTMKGPHQSNVATLMAQLVGNGALNLSCLKTVEFAEIDKTMILFLRLFLCKLAEQCPDEDKLTGVFEHLKSGKTKLVRRGLHLFLQYFMLKDENFMGQHSHLHHAFKTMASSVGKNVSTLL